MKNKYFLNQFFLWLTLKDDYRKILGGYYYAEHCTEFFFHSLSHILHET